MNWLVCCCCCFLTCKEPTFLCFVFLRWLMVVLGVFVGHCVGWASLFRFVPFLVRLVCFCSLFVRFPKTLYFCFVFIVFFIATLVCRSLPCVRLQKIKCKNANKKSRLLPKSVTVFVSGVGIVQIFYRIVYLPFCFGFRFSCFGDFYCQFCW